MRAQVLIVEDHALLAQSLLLALEAEGFGVSLCQALERERILTTAAKTNPDVVVLDLNLGGDLSTSLSVIAPLQADGARVVMLTGMTDRLRLAECVEAGAIGLIGKDEPFDRLIEWVKDAAELGTILSPGQRDDLMAELRRHRVSDGARLSRFQRLTKREAEVLTALMEGRSAEQIATQWVVSVATVRSQIRSLLMKLGVNSQLSAVAKAAKAGWSADAG